MEKSTSLLYRTIRGLVKLFYPKIEVVGAEKLPDEPFIVVGNHCQMNGPIACELYFPGSRYIWCAGQMMHLKEVPAYAFQDFWSKKPKRIRWFYRFLSYIIAPFSVCVFNNAHTIPVYRDARLMTTFRTSIEKLEQGSSLIIFPEHDKPYNNIICEFQDKFIDIARLHYKKTGKEACFVPLYLAPDLRQMHIGEAIRFNADAPIKEERQRICSRLMAEITSMAYSLPEHKVVPYNNVPKRLYLSNIPGEANENETTCC
ncbi:MAG: hypothetical protein E7430_02050 [Ruminococcaceae bacterium]|nr:hypothetical protein [Oscillospiraceae bacterium]